MGLWDEPTEEAGTAPDAEFADTPPEAPAAAVRNDVEAISAAVIADLSLERLEPTAPAGPWAPAAVVSEAASTRQPDVDTAPPADPIDAILQEEFGVYLQAANAPPPVPAFDAPRPWEPPVEPASEPIDALVDDEMPEPASPSLGGEAATPRRPLDDEWA